jgi:DNA-binding winged helix-turn-helix (wHTH) protein
MPVGGIRPSSAHGFNSQKLNSSSQPVMRVECERDPRRWSSAVVKTFGDFDFDDYRRRLRAGGQPVRLSGQAVDLLCLLLERPGELITREEIERRLWPDRNVVFNHSLDVIVSRLRTALGDKGSSPRYIETVPTKGYRFIEPLTAKPEARRANHHWRRRLVTYAAVAILSAILAILFARTRYDNFVPPGRSRASATVPAR